MTLAVDGYPCAWPAGTIPAVWREFGTRRLTCSWCGAQRRKGNRLQRPGRWRCSRCPIRFRRYRRGKRVVED